jgi:hypothetical protein
MAPSACSSVAPAGTVTGLPLSKSSISWPSCQGVSVPSAFSRSSSGVAVFGVVPTCAMTRPAGCAVASAGLILAQLSEVLLMMRTLPSSPFRRTAVSPPPTTV